MQLLACLLAGLVLTPGCERDLPPEAGIDFATPTEALYAPAQIVDVSTDGLAITMDGLAPTGSQIFIVDTKSGQIAGQAKAGEESGQDINWRAEFNLNALSGQRAVDSFGLKTQLSDDVEAISPERITILRKRPDNSIGPHQQAVIVSRPGAASMIIRDPLEPLVTSQGLRLYSIDYDNNGSVIFSGKSSVRGRIRIYVNGEAIGETGLGEGGNWFVIAGWTLPIGTYPIEIHRIGDDPRMPAFQTTILGAVFARTTFANMPPATLDRLAIAFTRSDPDERSKAYISDFIATPDMWEYRYDIPGGGQQYTAIYGAKAQGLTQTEGTEVQLQTVPVEPEN